MPFFAIFRCIRDILRVTVAFDHPVSECDIRVDFDKNEYPNIFVSRKQYERISEYVQIYRKDFSKTIFPAKILLC